MKYRLTIRGHEGHNSSRGPVVIAKAESDSIFFLEKMSHVSREDFPRIVSASKFYERWDEASDQWVVIHRKDAGNGK